MWHSRANANSMRRQNQFFKLWVDVSNEVHPNSRVHIAEAQSPEKLSAISTSTNQKFNTRSSTETELLEVDDIMTHAMWTSYFLCYQGYKLS